ncbi:hypothetical protein [Psychroserpens algicola]|uniref:Uncharacterized protein n=1 Tax=Psychroserpens algicola TaxID=1719034 RepID=A0ABT0H3Q2_9FLAO|nr:hypothetical protein [Psychroserpens algicola]MCK8479015.1 hypothetical protein [Psychroserpens algicola]
METLVASILIITIFVVSSLILNNLVSNRIRANVKPIMSHLHELEYLYANGKLEIPYHSDYKDWIVFVTKEKDKDSEIILFSASNSKVDKSIEVISYIK